ncbi:MAG: hypothetical protein QXE84_07075 [Candidatus Nitrosotenuis sp.]|uniref:Uncharacterized protein n=1 Tax=Candidatus Nitrosotenuis uzonensis TaxID=1407055 RepID=A0A812F2J8_9ARCH|nr:hypothetical protein [Candidatus Nitrosotenuis uzonensis]MCA2004134.1 hypothetical protein [Candidatus Nitrosotenuis sp.]CAE6496850.1 conserved hypothetical protein [Candidatus Nitrosotenuis uzonensis]
MKSGRKSTYAAIGIGIVVIALASFFIYSADQAKARGFSFGNQLQAIQDQLKQTQNEFYSKKIMLDEKDITTEEFLRFADEHFEKMNQIMAKYDELMPPESFSSSVKLFKMSTQKQIESDQFLVEWIRNGDESNKIRSDLLLQESFESEMAALASYEKARGTG